MEEHQYLITQLIALLVFVFGFISGYVYREIKLIRDIAANIDRIKATLTKVENEENTVGTIQARMILPLKHEIVKDVHYFFTEESDTFVCQGETLEQAAVVYEKVKQNDAVGRFTHSQDGRQYIFLDGKAEVCDGATS